MFLVRMLAGASSALAVLALSGCTSHWGCTDSTAERGQAGVGVQVLDTSGRPLRVTAETVDWRLEPHPQVPSQGNQVHFHYRFDGAEGGAGPAVDACAVDEERVALMCKTIHASDAWPEPDGARTGDDWLTVEDPGQVAGVLFIPNDQSHNRRSCAQDGKDGGGLHPPAHAGVGDRL